MLCFASFSHNNVFIICCLQPSNSKQYVCGTIKGQTISKANYGFLNSPKKQTHLAILSKEHAQDSEFRSFFRRIEEPKICFRDLTDL